MNSQTAQRQGINLKKYHFLEKDSVALGALFLFALVLRLVRLFDLDLIFDEVVLVMQAKHSFSQIWELCKLDNFPPLYPWLFKLWTSISLNPYWIRLFAALLSALTPPVAFLLGKELSDRKFAWLLGIALAISPCFMYWSQFVRMFNLQPLWVCLSLYGMLRGMKTNQWRYWIAMAFANLIGYYMYVFMAFFLAAQGLVLVYYYKFDLRRYFRPMITHIPCIIGISFWLAPVLNRYANVQQSFWSGKLTPLLFLQFLIILNIGTDVRKHLFVEILLSIPIWAGLIMAIAYHKKTQAIHVASFIILFVFGTIILISLSGNNFFHDRYLVFMLPIYIGLSIWGWMQLGSQTWRRIGIAAIFTTLSLSLIYYYVDFYYTHSNAGFVRCLPKAEKDEGHCISKMVTEVNKEIGQDEVIIHYSTPYDRIATYFSYVYYSNHDHRVLLYSRNELTQYNGRQYLNPGDQIEYLSVLKPLPNGVWLITLNKSSILLDKNTLAKHKLIKWIDQENLPLELEDAGYKLKNQITYGALSALHYRRTTTIDNKTVNNQGPRN
ncbi:MAG: glycosyltransferase family 39 protein [bacterium]|nr:glycosyltransferase family 39 protein [bacterium]